MYSQAAVLHAGDAFGELWAAANRDFLPLSAPANTAGGGPSSSATFTTVLLVDWLHPAKLRENVVKLEAAAEEERTRRRVWRWRTLLWALLAIFLCFCSHKIRWVRRVNGQLPCHFGTVPCYFVQYIALEQDPSNSRVHA